jgi:late competence protein required for DNA uptake (superfamily II DNA/RNA helicase)
MSRRKAKELVKLIAQAYESAEWDVDIHRELMGERKCFKCGSDEFEEALDTHNGVVYCCSDCPDYDKLN